jgi:acyl-homoserine-lactone acylase
MKKNLLSLCAILISQLTIAQINPEQIEIIRDSYGVPHIYAPTDAEVAYGLAWAHAEDDFETIQLGYLAGDAKLSRHLGLKGAPADFLTQLIEAQRIAEEQFHTLSDEFVALLEGYAQGLNAYAKNHPEEVLEKSLFPVTPIKMVAYSQLQLFVSNAADQLVKQIVTNKTPEIAEPKDDSNGSNLIALSSKKTGEKASYLTINTHQPLEGPTSWYEAHLVSDEGTNIIGTLFPGAPCILTGANEHLGWTHTVNFQDKADVFKLEILDKKSLTYRVDDQTLSLEQKKAKVYLKFLGFKIGINRKYYESIYGPTLKNRSGFYSVRTPSTTTIKALEQWWTMNKAQNFSEFYSALQMNALPGYNIGYADKYDTIFYISNGKMPIRNEAYDWKKTVPGNTLSTLWDSYYDTEDLPQVINPNSGFVYNANHSPFKSSGANDNPDPSEFAASMGYETYDNNRSTRLYELLSSNDQIDFNEFIQIKYDRTLPTPLNYNYVDFNEVFEMDPADYPGAGALLRKLQAWDRVADIDSEGAGIFAVLYYQLQKLYDERNPDNSFSRDVIYKALRKTSRYLKRHFKTQSITLGDFQKLVRGDKSIPIWGIPDVVTAMRGERYKKGRYRITNGESYIGLVQFTPKETRYRSVMSYGNSERRESLHYDDQMKLYQNFQTKPMYFDRDRVLADAVRRYRPE